MTDLKYCIASDNLVECSKNNCPKNYNEQLRKCTEINFQTGEGYIHPDHPKLSNDFL